MKNEPLYLGQNEQIVFVRRRINYIRSGTNNWKRERINYIIGFGTNDLSEELIVLSSEWIIFIFRTVLQYKIDKKCTIQPTLLQQNQ